MKTSWLLILILSVHLSCAVEIVITFDDFPMASSVLYGKMERVDAYVSQLDVLGVEEVF